MIGLLRRLAIERRMGATVIVPIRKTAQFKLESVRTKRYQNNTCAFVLERQDESFDERDTAMLANGAEARCDPLAITPVLEGITPKLFALVADDIVRVCTRAIHGTFEKVLN